MYLRITSRCNQQCPHCCYSCTEKGEDMTMEVLEKALESADEFITIGGGEPTVHPNFWELFGKLLGYAGEGLHIITNGLETDICWTLAKLGDKGVVGVGFSFDKYHKPIDPDLECFVREKADGARYNSTFNNRTSLLGYREGKTLSVIGRAKELSEAKNWEEYCPCEDFVVEPNGDVYACGHRELLLGTVWNWDYPKDWWDLDERCSRAYAMGMKELRRVG